jgi:hypothetical protein
MTPRSSTRRTVASPRRRAARRFTSSRQRSRGQLVEISVSRANSTLTAGTAVQNGLTTLMESAALMDLGGCLIARGWLQYVARPTATGSSSCNAAFFRGLDTLDVGDVLPGTDPDNNYINWQKIATYGQRHLVATTPTLEFDEFRRIFRHRAVRMRSLSDELWFVEEALGQNWEAQWHYRGWVDVS